MTSPNNDQLKRKYTREYTEDLLKKREYRSKGRAWCRRTVLEALALDMTLNAPQMSQFAERKWLDESEHDRHCG